MAVGIKQLLDALECFRINNRFVKAGIEGSLVIYLSPIDAVTQHDEERSPAEGNAACDLA